MTLYGYMQQMMDRGTTICTQYVKRFDRIPKNGGPQLRPEAIKKIPKDSV